MQPFEAIVAEHGQVVMRVCRALLGPVEAEDAWSETFLAAFRNLRGFRGEAKVSSWLHRIAVNQCLTRQRRARVRSESALDEDEDGTAQFAAPVEQSPANVVEGRQRTVAVRRAFNGLPVELRQIVVMKEFEELTFREIAEALELPLGYPQISPMTQMKSPARN